MMREYKERRELIPSFTFLIPGIILTFVEHAPPYGFWTLMSKGLKV